MELRYDRDCRAFLPPAKFSNCRTWLHCRTFLKGDSWRRQKAVAKLRKTVLTDRRQPVRQLLWDRRQNSTGVSSGGFGTRSVGSASRSACWRTMRCGSRSGSTARRSIAPVREPAHGEALSLPAEEFVLEFDDVSQVASSRLDAELRPRGKGRRTCFSPIRGLEIEFVTACRPVRLPAEADLPSGRDERRAGARSEPNWRTGRGYADPGGRCPPTRSLTAVTRSTPTASGRAWNSSRHSTSSGPKVSPCRADRDVFRSARTGSICIRPSSERLGQMRSATPFSATSKTFVCPRPVGRLLQLVVDPSKVVRQQDNLALIQHSRPHVRPHGFFDIITTDMGGAIASIGR